MKRLFPLLALLIFAGCGSASTPSSSPTPSPLPSPTAVPHHQIGETVMLPGWQFTVNSAKVAATSDGSPTNTAGDVWLVLDVNVVNTSNASQTFTSAEFRLRGTDGTDYSVPFALPSDPSGPVAAGGKLHGLIAYEVLPTARQFNLFYRPVADILATWDITVA